MIKKKKFFRARDVLGTPYIIKRFLILALGAFTYRRYSKINKLQINGTEHLKNLPSKGVLFISNHQTYFADVFAMYHVLCSVKNGFINTIRNPIYLLNPKVNIYYVAAEETMKNGFLPKLFSYSGCISIKRTWREAGKHINRQVNLSEITSIGKAINHGWVITFPQGTTEPFAPGRRGIIHILKKYKPIVAPIVLSNFNKAFNKKGIKVKEKGIHLKMAFKNPLEFDYENETSEEIMDKIMNAIEQSESYRKKQKELFL